MKKRKGFIDPISLSIIAGGSIIGGAFLLAALATGGSITQGLAGIMRKNKVQTYSKRYDIKGNTIPVVDQDVISKLKG